MLKMYAIFVCIYEFMNVFINKFIHVSVFVFVYLFMYLYKQACIDVSICVFLNGCSGMCGLWICVSMGGGGSQYLPVLHFEVFSPFRNQFYVCRIRICTYVRVYFILSHRGERRFEFAISAPPLLNIYR